MEQIALMSEILYSHVEQIDDVKTCTLNNVETTYYKVQWKCTWEPETVLQKFCGNIVDEYKETVNNHSAHKKHDNQREAMLDVVQKVQEVVQKIQGVQVENASNSIRKDLSSGSIAVIDNSKDINIADNDDIFIHSSSINKTNNMKPQHSFLCNVDNSINCDNIKPDPGDVRFPNINILDDSVVDACIESELTSTSKFPNTSHSFSKLSTPIAKARKSLRTSNISTNDNENNAREDSSSNLNTREETDLLNKASLKINNEAEGTCVINESTDKNCVRKKKKKKEAKLKVKIDKQKRKPLQNADTSNLNEPDSRILIELEVSDTNNLMNGDIYCAETSKLYDPTSCNTLYNLDISKTNNLRNHYISDAVTSALNQPFQSNKSEELEKSTTNTNVMKPFKCCSCSYSTAFKGYLRLHMRKHTGEKPYKCNQCSYAAAHLHLLKVHTAKHTSVKSLKCSQCEFSTTHIEYLKKHVKHIHEKHKPYKCSQCSYEGIYKSSLRKHQQTHHLPIISSGDELAAVKNLKIIDDVQPTESNYKSKIKSNKLFTKLFDKSKELDNAYLDKSFEIKPFKCQLCSFSTASNTYLKSHMRKHTGEKPYTCNQCSYAAAHLHLLKIHRNKHDSEKSLKCNKCSFTTSHMGYLKRHERNVHIKVRPFKCNECSYEAAYQCTLQKHQQTHVKNSEIMAFE